MVLVVGATPRSLLDSSNSIPCTPKGHLRNRLFHANSKKERKNTSDDHARPQSSITMTSPNISTCLRFPPRVELASTSSDRSITLSDACTSLRLLVPRVGRDTASIPSPVKSTSAVASRSAAPSGPADCALARPLPLAEVRFVVADGVVVVVIVDEEGGTAEGGDGGGDGLAYNSVH